MIGQQITMGELRQAATQAQQAEIEFRESITREMKQRERNRQFAFRRVALAETMFEAIVGAQSLEEACDRQWAALKGEVGWHADTEQRKKVLAAWRPVSEAVWAHAQAGAANAEPAKANSALPLLEAMMAFEQWYEAECGASFLAVFDHEMPEIPVVEF